MSDNIRPANGISRTTKVVDRLTQGVRCAITVCIINNMPSVERPHKMTLRLSDAEEKLRDALAIHLGTDGSGVMRQGLLKLARDQGIAIPETHTRPAPKKR